MRINAVLIMILAILTLGCERQATEAQLDQQVIETLKQEWTNEYEHLMVFAKENTSLMDLLENLKQSWKNDNKTKSFVAQYEIEGETTEIHGRFSTPDYWEMIGKKGLGETFIVQQTEGSVTLRYDDIQEQLSVDEFMFILPLEHFEWLTSMLDSDQYEKMEWRMAEDGWNLTLVSTLEPMREEIERFFKSHLDEEHEWHSDFLRTYKMVYYLHITETNQTLDLSSLTFQLQKNGQELEEVKFTF